MNFTALILLGLEVSLTLIVFSLGLRASFRDATFLFRNPGQFVRAFLSMNVVMPLLALALGATFNLHPAVKIAFVVIAVSPVPPVFPKKAIKSGCKEDYAVGLVVAISLLSILIVPVTMGVIGGLANIHLQMPAFQVAKLVLTSVFAPLLTGMVIRAMLPRLAENFAGPLNKLATAVLLLCALPVLFASMKDVGALIGNGTLLSVVAFAVGGLIIGHLIGGPTPENRRVLSLATATRHPAIAAAIAHTNFPSQKLAVPAIILYLLVAGVLSAFVSRKPAATERSETTIPRAA